MLAIARSRRILLQVLVCTRCTWPQQLSTEISYLWGQVFTGAFHTSYHSEFCGKCWQKSNDSCYVLNKNFYIQSIEHECHFTWEFLIIEQDFRQRTIALAINKISEVRVESFLFSICIKSWAFNSSFTVIPRTYGLPKNCLNKACKADLCNFAQLRSFTCAPRK